MGRLPKTGLDYFPLVTTFEDKMVLIIAEFGAAGLGVIVSLYQKIYSQGYYCKWDQDVLMLFARYINEDINRVNEVIMRSFYRGILDETMYKKHGILTSRGIQKQYLKVCRDTRRKRVEMVRDYCLVKDPDLLAIITEYIDIDEDINEVYEGKNHETTPINPPGSTQRERERERERESTDLSSEPQGPDKTKNQNNQKYEPDSQPLKAAIHLRNLIKNNNPKARVPPTNIEDSTLQNWALELDRLHRIGPPGGEGGYTWKEIKEIMEWCQQDSFWWKNILSAAKFREKIIQLENQYKSKGGGGNGKPGKAPKPGFKPSEHDWDAESQRDRI